MELVTCSSCGNQNNSDQFFCKKCGKFLLDNKKDGVHSEAEWKLSRISANLKETPHVDILWNDTVDQYTRKIEKLQNLLRLKDTGIDSAELTEKIDDFLELCRKPDFEIAFVGAVKAGKSTMINALLGRNYATTDPNPETAVLTKFRSSEKDYLNVKFYTQEEWDKLWITVQTGADKFIQLYRELEAGKQKDKWVGREDYHIELDNSEIENELSKWSSSKSPCHFFVKEIEVGISSLSKEFPKQVVFVDTPGLFDPVAFRSQISIDYIHKANAVLVCVKAEDLHGEEVKTIESVFSFSGHKRNKVFIIATNWDKLNNVVSDWNKRYDYMIDSFTGKAFFPTKEMAKNNILYAASYHYNLCRDYASLSNAQKNEINIFLMKIQNAVELCEENNIKVPGSIKALSEVQIGMLTDFDLKNLKDATNIQVINKVVVSEFVNQYAELLCGDIKHSYEDIHHMVKRIVGERKQTLNNRITISYSDLKEIEQKIEETQRNNEEIRKVQKQLTIALQNVNKMTNKRLNNITSQIR